MPARLHLVLATALATALALVGCGPGAPHPYPADGPGDGAGADDDTGGWVVGSPDTGPTTDTGEPPPDPPDAGRRPDPVDPPPDTGSADPPPRGPLPVALEDAPDASGWGSPPCGGLQYLESRILAEGMELKEEGRRDYVSVERGAYGDPAPGLTPTDRLGAALASTGGGRIVAVGAPSNHVELQGGVYVYACTAVDGLRSWQRIAELRPGSATMDFGRGVALDGSELVVADAPSSPRFDDSGVTHVHVYRVVEPGGDELPWVEPVQEIEGEDGFGARIALADGTLYVSTPFAGSGEHPERGLVEVFRRTGDGVPDDAAEPGAYERVQSIGLADVPEEAGAIGLSQLNGVVFPIAASQGRLAIGQSNHPYLVPHDNGTVLEELPVWQWEEDGHQRAETRRVDLVTEHAPARGQVLLFAPDGEGRLRFQQALRAPMQQVTPGAGSDFGASLAMEGDTLIVGEPGWDRHIAWRQLVVPDAERFTADGPGAPPTADPAALQRAGGDWVRVAGLFPNPEAYFDDEDVADWYRARNQHYEGRFPWGAGVAYDYEAVRGKDGEVRMALAGLVPRPAGAFAAAGGFGGRISIDGDHLAVAAPADDLGAAGSISLDSGVWIHERTAKGWRTVDFRFRGWPGPQCAADRDRSMLRHMGPVVLDGATLLMGFSPDGYTSRPADTDAVYVYNVDHRREAPLGFADCQP